MRLLSVIGYGTSDYPEEIARRLRVLNIAAFMATVLTAGFAASFFASGAPDLLIVGTANAVVAIILATVPLLHRFGALVGPLTVGVVANAAIFIICSMVGTDTGMPIQYLALMAVMIVVVGVEHKVICGIFGVLAPVLIIGTDLLVPADTGLQPRSQVVASLIAGTSATCAILFAIVFYALRDTARAEATAEREYQRSETLLHNILPGSIAERLKAGDGLVIADRHDAASVLFADMAGFTERAGDTLPEDLVQFLNDVFTRFDRLVESHGLEKIKTTGDAYMVVSGVPEARPDHAQALADFALAMRDTAAEFRDPHGRNVPIRIGMACGPVVAGVVGTRKIFYDVWGDTVNVASRMESTGEAGRIQVSQDACARLNDEFVLEPRGAVDVKGKGRMATWYLIERR
ncbi:adenylate cyclase [Mesorhizobium sp. L-8-10]|uniref:adenylate/guanylate cyclase domain-containing protein n=1 Tax=Mesorhizobium sp. L-8-10 TaxID=2744523 RepID=UPI00192686B3|nr:adenylate/guanylate cyclase domain-containing protein [Mesorhizobium sp. L-8-10]BCH31136.1 adenylate cyclase [Mesorhizobium sp. L-8-10]